MKWPWISRFKAEINERYYKTIYEDLSASFNHVIRALETMDRVAEKDKRIKELEAENEKLKGDLRKLENA